MRTHTVIDGNAFYEVDDECMERQKREKENRTENGVASADMERGAYCGKKKECHCPGQFR